MTFSKLPVGSCGSGADPDCNNRDSGDDEYDMILCCPITGEEVITKTFCESILFTYKQQMKVTHGETVMSLRLSMVRISAVSTVAMLCR